MARGRNFYLESISSTERIFIFFLFHEDSEWLKETEVVLSGRVGRLQLSRGSSF